MKERNYTIDFLRLVAILAVILIHTSNTSMQLGYYSLSHMPVSFFLNHFSRFAVGVFFAISGYLLASRFNPDTPVLSFYKRRVSKLLLPYIIWSAIYYISFFNFDVSTLFSLNFLEDLFSGNASYQLYFIPTIFILYFLFPYIMKLKKVILSKWFLGIYLVLQMCFLNYMFLTGHDLPLYTTLRNAVIYSFPFLCGAYTGVTSDITKMAKKHWLLAVLFAVSSLYFMMQETWNMFYLHVNPNYIRTQWRATSPVYALSMGLILAYLHIHVTHAMHHKITVKLNKFIMFLSSLSMGVYFAHVAFISFFWRIIGSYMYSLTQGHVVNFFWFDFFQFAAVTIASFTAIFLVGKVKFLGNLLGAKVG